MTSAVQSYSANTCTSSEAKIRADFYRLQQQKICKLSDGPSDCSLNLGLGGAEYIAGALAANTAVKATHSITQRDGKRPQFCSRDKSAFLQKSFLLQFLIGEKAWAKGCVAKKDLARQLKEQITKQFKRKQQLVGNQLEKARKLRAQSIDIENLKMNLKGQSDALGQINDLDLKNEEQVTRIKKFLDSETAKLLDKASLTPEELKQLSQAISEAHKKNVSHLKNLILKSKKKLNIHSKLPASIKLLENEKAHLASQIRELNNAQDLDEVNKFVKNPVNKRSLGKKIFRAVTHLGDYVGKKVAIASFGGILAPGVFAADTGNDVFALASFTYDKGSCFAKGIDPEDQHLNSYMNFNTDCSIHSFKDKFYLLDLNNSDDYQVLYSLLQKKSSCSDYKKHVVNLEFKNKWSLKCSRNSFSLKGKKGELQRNISVKFDPEGRIKKVKNFGSVLQFIPSFNMTEGSLELDLFSGNASKLNHPIRRNSKALHIVEERKRHKEWLKENSLLIAESASYCKNFDVKKGEGLDAGNPKKGYPSGDQNTQ
jgi:hypothetical protein